MADNKLHSMHTTEQELSGVFSLYYKTPYILYQALSYWVTTQSTFIMYRFHCYVLCSLCGWSLETRSSTGLASAKNIHSLIVYYRSESIL